jgi:hypothetical protein
MNTISLTSQSLPGGSPPLAFTYFPTHYFPISLPSTSSPSTRPPAQTSVIR